jgi:hypothetical protein
MQTSSILSQVVAVSLVISLFPSLQDTPPITTTNLLKDVDFLL